MRDTSGAALAGHAVYLWPCDRNGQHSMTGDVTGGYTATVTHAV